MRHIFVIAAALAVTGCVAGSESAHVPPTAVVAEIAPPPTPAPVVATNDRACLIAAMFYEAGGEGAEGLAAVGHVVLNRLDDRPPGTTLCDVVYEKGQFGWTRKVARTDVAATIGTSQRWQNAAIMAEAVLTDTVKDPTGGAHSFYSVLQYRKKPRWAKNLDKTVRIGNHVFMR
ncbi:cell wall hydrolase [Zavarzinia sp.]|uniref:cell wall hydrolase n=1 Tax=Zavarzinia sp. TaxID=2027920 RepID=UPI003BB4DCA0